MKAAFFSAGLLGLTALSVCGKGDSPAASHKISLTQCLQIAIDHNAQLGIASTQFLAAKGRVIKLHAILYPTLNSQTISTPLTFYVQFQQTFYNHATFPQLRLSRLSEEQAFINYNQVLNDVVFRVRQAFTSALGSRQQADLLQEYADRQANEVTSSQQLFDAGKVQKGVILSAQVKRNLIQQRREAAELAYTQALLALDQLLGQELPKSTRLVGDFIKDAPSKLDVGELSATALRDRPDLKLLESLQLSAEQQIQIDMKNLYPVVGFSSDAAIQPPSFGPTGSFDLERNEDEPAVQRQPGNTQLPLSLYFTWQIFDGGKHEGIKASDQARIASRDVAITELKQSIPGEIASAVATLTSERDMLQTLNAQASPDELRHSAELDYEAGRLRQQDKINLEDTILFQQQLQLGSKIRLSLAAAALDHALGRGLEIATSPAISGP